MPNWNYNVVEVSHSQKKMMAKFKKGCKNGLFTEFLPVPEEQKENWYEWCVSNWGTKWDVTEVDCIIEGNSTKVTFDTAWAPPIAFYEHLIELGFTVTAYYYEPGMAFCGIYDELGDAYYEIGDLNSDEVEETIPKELDEMFGISEEKASWEDEENQEIELEDAFDDEMTEEEIEENLAQLNEAFAELEAEQNSAKGIARQEILLAIDSLKAALAALDSE